MLIGIFLLVVFIAFIACIAFLGAAAAMAAQQDDKQRCGDCDYFERRLCKGYCYHWEEKRNEDAGICPTFKKIKARND